MQATVVRVVVADDYRLLLEAVQALLDSVADIEVAGVTHKADCILPLVARLAPDLLLLDSRMPGMEELAMLDRLRAAHPAVAVVLLADSSDPKLASAALERGAKAVILKGADPDTLLAALRAASRGETVPAAPQATGPHGLTLREQAVLRGLVRGLSLAEIGRELSIGYSTVRTHLRSAYTKLGVATRLEAVCLLLKETLHGNPYDWL